MDNGETENVKANMTTEKPLACEKPLAWLLDDNLMSSMRIQNGLAALNYRVQIARSRVQAEQWGSSEQWGSGNSNEAASPALVLINLGSRSLDGVSLIASYRERFNDARIVGFCGHLETEIRRAARAAGIDTILTNEEAFSGLSNALSRLESRANP